MTGHFDAATQAECPVCGGPCREPFPFPHIHDRYPFMTPEEIAHVNTEAAADSSPAEPTAASPRTGRRRRISETHQRQIEDRAHHPAEDR